MRPARLIVAAALATVATPVLAQSGHTLSGNLALVSDYRFRGVSQTYNQPAVQGGFDYGSTAGLYGSAWGSNVSGNQFLNGASLELDLYGGYRLTAAGGRVGLDFGAQYYWYPSARYNIDPGNDYNTAEVYLGARYDHFAAKYSYALTDLFGMNTATIGGYCGISPDGSAETTNCLGTGDSKGSGYVDLNATFDVVGGASLALHYGYQHVQNYAPLSYSDYRIGLSRQFGGVALGAAFVATNAEDRFYRYAPTTGGSQETEDVAKSAIVLSATKAF